MLLQHGTKLTLKVIKEFWLCFFNFSCLTWNYRETVFPQRWLPFSFCLQDLWFSYPLQNLFIILKLFFPFPAVTHYWWLKQRFWDTMFRLFHLTAHFSIICDLFKVYSQKGSHHHSAEPSRYLVSDIHSMSLCLAFRLCKQHVKRLRCLQNTSKRTSTLGE